MTYFSIEILFNTIDSDDVIHKPEISVCDTTFRGAVNQIRYVVSASALPKISSAYVWYMGKSDVGTSEILSLNCYNGEEFIAILKKTLGEDLI
jgi:hypothetical protein